MVGEIATRAAGRSGEGGTGEVDEFAQTVAAQDAYVIAILRLSLNKDDGISQCRQMLGLRVSFVCHSARARLQPAQLCAAPFSRPSFFVFLRSVRVPPYLVRLDRCRNLP